MEGFPLKRLDGGVRISEQGIKLPEWLLFFYQVVNKSRQQVAGERKLSSGDAAGRSAAASYTIIHNVFYDKQLYHIGNLSTIHQYNFTFEEWFSQVNYPIINGWSLIKKKAP